MRDVILQQVCSILSLPGGDGIEKHFFAPGDHDIWPWNSSERGTRHVFPVNLAQMHSAVPKIFDAQTINMKKSQTELITEPYLRAVIIVKPEWKHKLCHHDMHCQT